MRSKKNRCASTMTNKVNKLESIPNSLLTKKETARRLKVCVRKVELMVNAGEIPVIRLGSAVRFNWQAVLHALENPNHGEAA